MYHALELSPRPLRKGKRKRKRCARRQNLRTAADRYSVIL